MSSPRRESSQSTSLGGFTLEAKSSLDSEAEKEDAPSPEQPQMGGTSESTRPVLDTLVSTANVGIAPHSPLLTDVESPISPFTPHGTDGDSKSTAVDDPQKDLEETNEFPPSQSPLPKGRRRLYFPFLRYPFPSPAKENNPSTLGEADLLPPLRMKIPKARENTRGGGISSSSSSTPARNRVTATHYVTNPHWWLDLSKFLSVLTFSWLEPLMKLGYTRPLEATDLWKIAADDRIRPADGQQKPQSNSTTANLPPHKKGHKPSFDNSPMPSLARTLTGLDSVDPSSFSHWGPNAPPVPPELEFDAGRLGEGIIYHWERRKREAKEWNERLERDETTAWERGKERINGWFKPWRRLKLDVEDKKNKKTRYDLLRKPTLVLAANDVFWGRIWKAGLLKLVADVLMVTSPLISKELIKYSAASYYAHKLDKPAPGIGRGLGYAFGLFGMQVISAICTHQFWYLAMGGGVLIRGALTSAIYRRALLLSSKARVNIPNSRLIVHLGTDTSRIDVSSSWILSAATGPIQIAIISVILIVNLGASCLPGLGFLILTVPLQGWNMKMMLTYRRRTMVWTDKRIKTLQELLGGIRVIKFFAWETPYFQKIVGIRANELLNTRNVLILKSGLSSVSVCLPAVAAVLSFVTYGLTGHTQDAATIFSSLSLFNMLLVPLTLLPIALNTVVDAKNSFDRLREVFDAPLMDKPFEIDPSAKYAVEVQSGCFEWEGLQDEPIQNLKREVKVGSKGPLSQRWKMMRVARKERKPSRLSLAKWVQRKQDGKVVEQGSIHDIDPQDKSTSKGEDLDSSAKKMEEKAKVEVVEAGAIATTSEIRDINLQIERGKLVAIVGPVGSGKSSLLNALVGEMRRKSGSIVFGGRVGYCPQQAWIQNASLRDNILFGLPWDEDKYAKVIKDACLQPDIDMLPARDLTEIGEKGITLSGGQKQRINIARALYFDADIVCLDDPLSAVDAHVGSHLFSHAIQGALAGKTRLLVTHALHFLPQVDYIICLDNGQISERGTYSELVAKNGPFARLINDFSPPEEKSINSKKSNQKADNDDHKEVQAEKKKLVGGANVGLMQREEINRGHVSGSVYLHFIVAAKGWVMVPVVITALCLAQGSTIMENWWLTWWQNDKFNRGSHFYMALYGVLAVCQMVFTFTMNIAGVVVGYNASKALHDQALRRLLRAPASFFDTTPLGRIINRMARDMDTVDNQLNDSVRMALQTLGSVLGSVVLIGIILPYFLIVVLCVGGGYWLTSKYYRSSARELKRLDNVLRSSLYAHFSESLSGLATIRAYGESKRFIDLNDYYMNLENRAYYLTVVNQHWLGLRLDACGTLLVLVVALLNVGSRFTLNPSNVGLVLNYVIGMQASFSSLVKQSADVENNMGSTERMVHYTRELEQEAPAHNSDNKPDTLWPSKGEVNFDKVVMSYRLGLPAVLKGVSFQARASEKIGIVGRTGAGKSTIMQALFRMTELTSGRITIDDVDISGLGLEDLRKSIAIIPQDALLFSGTLRSNLDPFNQYEDHRLWDALKRAWLVDPTIKKGDDTQDVLGETSNRPSKFNLDMRIDGEGSNLSIGERSLVSLARALVKDSRIIVLDEATASVDLMTDHRIQTTIREEFKDKTLLCIAHRLRTIIGYDRILVMDAGKIAEFDRPENLFDNAESLFRGMCESSSITKEDILSARTPIN